MVAIHYLFHTIVLRTRHISPYPRRFYCIGSAPLFLHVRFSAAYGRPDVRQTRIDVVEPSQALVTGRMSLVAGFFAVTRITGRQRELAP